MLAPTERGWWRVHAITTRGHFSGTISDGNETWDLHLPRAELLDLLPHHPSPPNHLHLIIPFSPPDTKTIDLPNILHDWWMAERDRGCPFTVHYHLPSNKKRHRASTSNRGRHRPVHAKTNMLMASVTGIERYDVTTEMYNVEIKTNQHLWTHVFSGRLLPHELGDALHRSPPVYIPDSCLPTLPPAPRNAGGLWWRSTERPKMQDLGDRTGLIFNFHGLLIGDGEDTPFMLDSVRFSEIWRTIAAAPTSILTSFSEKDLGLPPNDPLPTLLHDYWSGERRRLSLARAQRHNPTASIPVEIECRLHPNPLLHLPAHIPTPDLHQSELPAAPPSPSPPPDPNTPPLPRNTDLLPNMLLGIQ